MLFLNLSALILLAYTYRLLHSAPSVEKPMSQKALLLHEVGKPLAAGYRPIPQPGENQLLVTVLVAGSKFTSHSTCQ